MSKYLGIIVGALEIAGGIALDVFVPGGAAYGNYLIGAGVGSIIGNVGTLLSQPQGGLGTASRNPTMPWNVVYGQRQVGGTIVYINSFGDNDKYLDIVFVLACHPCLSIDSLLFDNQRIPINPANNSSHSPSQQTVSISSIVRAYGLVTVVTAGAISDLQPGDRVEIKNVSGTGSFDRSLNAVVYVYEVLSGVSFTYLSGGLDISLGATGQVKTMWPDYRSKVYCEFLNGDHTSTFYGMLNGTPYDGDTGNLVTVSNNPWTSQHVLNGRACAFLRLHYNDEVFSSGLPQIAFRLHGKKDIYDPRNDASTVVAAPTVLMNGWGNNAHEGPYELGDNLAFHWGVNDDTTYPYASVEDATDGNPSSYCGLNYRHTHKYAGCIWVFPYVAPTSPATTLYLSILSAVPSSGPGSLRSAGIYYSLDAGATWTKIYDQSIRAEQWDNITLPSGQDTSHVQVMAFMDSHDDMTHFVYEIRLATAPASTVQGYTENAALCIADYLANTTYGFKAAYGSEIPLAPLITAANICDETVPLATGATEPRYPCNGGFQLTTSRGEILQNMLTACGGRITYSSGQFVIHPAAWPGTSFTIGAKTAETAVLYFTTSHTLGVGWSGYATVTLGMALNQSIGIGAGALLYDSAGYSVTTNTSNWTASGQQWSGPIGPLATMSDPTQAIVSFHLWNSIGGDTTTTPDIFRVYDCYMIVTYQDLSTMTFRPASASIVQPQADGALLHPQNAIDTDTSTYAEIQKHHFSLFGFAPYLQLHNWVPESGAAGPPDLSGSGVLESVAVLGAAAGPFTWKSRLPIRELYNGVKGQYVSPANGWQNSDFPPYAQDADHGYTGPAAFDGDQNLADDGGDRRWLEIQLPFTISPFGAQRLAKIELMRKRQQGAGTFSFNMSLYKTTALDVIAMTLPILGWNGKLLEVAAHRLVFNRNQEGPTLGCELDLQETSPGIYDWSVTEQLVAQGTGLGVLPNTSNVSAPTTTTAISNSTTSVTGADGISRSQILVTWPAPTDGFVTSGGHVEIQYQQSSSPAGPWMSAAPVGPDVTQAYIGGVKDGATYNVQTRFVNAAGSPSDWTASAPVTVSGTASVIPPGNISQGGATTGQVLVWNGSAWVPTTPTGGGGSSTAPVLEIPAGTLDGSNKVFTISTTPNPAGWFILFLNGVEQVSGSNYALSGTTITYAVAPKTTDVHIASYMH